MYQHPDNIINENRNIRHHIKPKTSLIHSNNKDLANNNTNNNNNNISMANNNHTKPPKFGVQQVNSSNKMLDNQKYQKYYSKRKLLAQYEQEMRQEKRNRITEHGQENYDDNDKDRPLNMRKSSADSEDRDNDNCVGLNLIQNIKTERSADDDHNDTTNGDDCSSTGNESGGYYATHLGKIKHSILEPNIVLNHSDEVLSTTAPSPRPIHTPSREISQQSAS
jgi:hypothetical protein